MDPLKRFTELSDNFLSYHKKFLNLLNFLFLLGIKPKILPTTNYQDDYDHEDIEKDLEASVETLIEVDEEDETHHQKEMKKERNNFHHMSYILEKTNLDKLENYHDTYPLLSFRKGLCKIR